MVMVKIHVDVFDGHNCKMVKHEKTPWKMHTLWNQIVLFFLLLSLIRYSTISCSILYLCSKIGLALSLQSATKLLGNGNSLKNNCTLIYSLLTDTVNRLNI